MYEVLRPILNEIKEDISCMKSDMASLNETVSQLADHKNETTSELASVNSELVDLQLSLQSMIDNPPIEAVSSAVLVSLVPYFNAMESGLKTELATGLNSMNSSLRDDLNSMEHEIKTEFATGLMSMRGSLEHGFVTGLSMMNSSLRGDLNSMELDIKTEFATGLNTMSSSMRDDLNDIKTGVTNTTQGLCDKIEEHDAEISAELKEMSDYIIPQSGYTCGGTGGWRRLVYLDMTDPNTECPSGWSTITIDSKKTCGRASTGWNNCDSVFFPVSGGPYSQVCGRIRAYQWGLGAGFYGFNNGRTTIDSKYFDGVAVMHGSPRQHIWTFVNGAWENGTRHRYYNCPCDTTGYVPIPPFVGEDYFCESGYVYPGYRSALEYRLHSNDTLWDGEDCHSSSSCCSLHNPPYFTKSLGQSTTADLELRMCSIFQGSIAIELLEVYVKEVDLHSELDLIGEHMNDVKSKLMEINQNLLHHTNLYTCGGTGSWRRAVYLDMTDPNTNCPSGWILTDYSKRTCGRASTGYYKCDSVLFPVSGGPYSQMCGRIRAYQSGLGEGFHRYTYGKSTIDRSYFEGVAIMHRSPRQHIWTFAIGAWENDTTHRPYNCPCDTTGDVPTPPFVGGDYFCESGYVYPGHRNNTLEYRLHSNDTLWDGEDCHSSSSCCSLHNPPYFTKSLGQSTTADLELRMCHRQRIPYVNTAVELVELYVK